MDGERAFGGVGIAVFEGVDELLDAHRFRRGQMPLRQVAACDRIRRRVDIHSERREVFVFRIKEGIDAAALEVHIGIGGSVWRFELGSGKGCGQRWLRAYRLHHSQSSARNGYLHGFPCFRFRRGEWRKDFYAHRIILLWGFRHPIGANKQHDGGVYHQRSQ